jgi:phage tail sheath protein FI
VRVGVPPSRTFMVMAIWKERAMPEYLSPGVYVQEVDSGPRPIEGVGTACAAFVGFAPAGPANVPTLVTNWSQYVGTFGSLDEGGRRNPHMPGAYLSHAVYGYFLNGGGRCYVTRIAPEASNGRAAAETLKAAPLQLPSKSSKAIPSITVSPKGAPVQDIEVEVAPPTGDSPPEGTFTLKIRTGGAEEAYDNVSLGRRGARNVIETVNQASQIVTLAEEQSTGTIVERMPEVGTYLLKAQQVAIVPKLQASSFTGNVAERTGMEGLEIAEDVTMVCCPDLMAAYEAGAIDQDGVKAVQLAMIAHCERMSDRIAILDPLPGLSPQQVKTWRERDTNYDSKFAALYYPWIKVAGPDGKPMAVPPSGHMAGIWARNDNERGVHKAPANEVIRGALEAAATVTKGEQDTLNPIGVNCIRSFTGRGLRVWGARTLSSDPAWRYINVRRLFNYVEKSIEAGTQWVVFEPNDPDLWARVKRDIGAFLTGVWRDGMLFGANPGEAFFVKCDEELNPPDVRDRGQLFIDVGLAPVKPAEFVVFRFSQFSGGGA